MKQLTKGIIALGIYIIKSIRVCNQKMKMHDLLSICTENCVAMHIILCI